MCDCSLVIAAIDSKHVESGMTSPLNYPASSDVLNLDSLVDPRSIIRI